MYLTAIPVRGLEMNKLYPAVPRRLRQNFGVQITTLAVYPQRAFAHSQHPFDAFHRRQTHLFQQPQSVELGFTIHYPATGKIALPLIQRAAPAVIAQQTERGPQRKPVLIGVRGQ